MSAIERKIEISEIENLLAQEGALVELQGNTITSTDPDTNVKMTHILIQDEDGVGAVLYNTILLKQLKKEEVSSELCLKLLSIDNGINTSNFRLIPNKQGYSLVLQNFTKLQNMGEEDVDDILSALSYLVTDVAASRKLFGEIAPASSKKSAIKATPSKETNTKSSSKNAGTKKKK